MAHQMTALTPYPGPIPSNVRQDAKYRVRHGDNGFEVNLEFQESHRSRYLLTTELHPALVDMVNAVKVQAQGREGGVFYINEWGHVLVPTQGGDCYFAGTYDDLLEFDLEGQVVSPEPAGGLEPGDHWPGPHVGVRYQLGVGDAIYYVEKDGRRETQIHLGDVQPSAAATGFARRIGAAKGDAGRLYVNEVRAVFAPALVDGIWVYVYCGRIEDSDPWFDEPVV